MRKAKQQRHSRLIRKWDGTSIVATEAQPVTESTPTNSAERGTPDQSYYSSDQGLGNAEGPAPADAQTRATTEE